MIQPRMSKLLPDVKTLRRFHPNKRRLTGLHKACLLRDKLGRLDFRLTSYILKDD
jgi:hypothetical protein